MNLLCPDLMYQFHRINILLLFSILFQQFIHENSNTFIFPSPYIIFKIGWATHYIRQHRLLLIDFRRSRNQLCSTFYHKFIPAPLDLISDIILSIFHSAEDDDLLSRLLSWQDTTLFFIYEKNMVTKLRSCCNSSAAPQTYNYY